MATEETQPVYPSETEERNLDYPTLTPGYIRSVIKLNVEGLPKVIIDLCNKYVIPTIFEDEKDDSVNFISNNDIQISDQYKIEGNKYFKSNNYDDAIMKYTTALKFNPNNHLIYSNRAYCYYLLSNYDDAIQDIKLCVDIQPSFYKAWYRYGLILQKQQKYGNAAIAYRTAYNLSINWNNNQNEKDTNPYKVHYEKYMKFLQNEDKLEAIKYINEFDKKSNANWLDTFDSIATKYPQIKELMEMRDRNELNEENIIKFQEMMLNETALILKKEENDFYSNVEQSKCYYFIQENAFKFDDDVNGEDEFWDFSWSSTPQINNNKRIFCLSICCRSGIIINSWMVHGKPNADQCIYTLFRTITYRNITKLKCIKPRWIRIAYRMRNEFKAIQTAMHRIGVYCLLQSSESNLTECQKHGTNVNGWNHL